VLGALELGLETAGPVASTGEAAGAVRTVVGAFSALAGVWGVCVVLRLELEELEELLLVGELGVLDPELFVPELLVPELLVPELLVPELLVPELLVSELFVPELLVPELLELELLVPELLELELRELELRELLARVAPPERLEAACSICTGAVSKPASAGMWAGASASKMLGNRGLMRFSLAISY
jgi:hypothetical protein